MHSLPGRTVAPVFSVAYYEQAFMLTGVLPDLFTRIFKLILVTININQYRSVVMAADVL